MSEESELLRDVEELEDRCLPRDFLSFLWRRSLERDRLEDFFLRSLSELDDDDDELLELRRRRLADLEGARLEGLRRSSELLSDELVELEREECRRGLDLERDLDDLR